MTAIYLAYATTGHDTLAAYHSPLRLLVAFPWLKPFEERRDAYDMTDWVLDSGAFSAHQSGKPIDLDDYIAACKRVDAREVFGLDVIGDPTATRKNNERMWAEGIDAIPTFHMGAPWSALEDMKHCPKIALGGVARRRDASNVRDWIEQCFARVWPKKIHGFGLVRELYMRAVPFHSVDASSWTLGPSSRGIYMGYTGRYKYLGTRKRDWRVEVDGYQKRERFYVQRWRREMALLEALEEENE